MGKRSALALSKRKAARYGWLGVLAVIVVVGIVLGWRMQAPPPRVAGNDPALSSGTVAPAVARRETRPTLDPALFVGKAALVHQVAREIPEVLDQLHCYCACDKFLGHKSLLSCYTDSHAAT